jgi:hypothetical protein
MSDNRDSLIFYRSFYEAISELPAQNQAEVYDAIFDYSLNFNQPELSGLSKTIFTLIKPQLDANIKRYRNGKQPKVKQEISKPEAKQKQTESKTEGNKNVNVNANENNNLNDNENINQGVTPVSGLPFTNFWDIYEKNVGQDKTRTAWYMISENEQTAIMGYLPKYIKATPEVKFRKNPLNFINEKTWLDDLPKVEKKSVHTPINKFGYVKAESKEIDWDVVKRDLDRIEAEGKIEANG